MDMILILVLADGGALRYSLSLYCLKHDLIITCTIILVLHHLNQTLIMEQIHCIVLIFILFGNLLLYNRESIKVKGGRLGKSTVWY